jgi:hypothetical protein
MEELLELRARDEGSRVAGRLSQAVSGWPGLMADAARLPTQAGSSNGSKATNGGSKNTPNGSSASSDS